MLTKSLRTMEKFFSQKVLLLLCCILFSSHSIIAQTVTGTITDNTGLALIGANILVEGTSKGTITDIDGKFTIAADKGDQLRVSYIGFVDQLITIGDNTSLEIVLAEDATALEEVVVVGYGTRKKSHNTGAIAQVVGKDVAAIQAPRVDDALAGKMAGVLIQNQSGEPGADPKIQIRAASSITGNSNPLIVVDGYPISGNLATVNPNDIESVEVLKDAASAAIYGSRGANGVILVTTKNGEAGKTKFSYNAYTSFSKKYRDNINMTAAEFADHAEANIANGTWDVSELESIAPGFVDYKLYGFRNSPDVVAIEDHVFGTGTTQSHDFNMSGGSDNTKFFASIGSKISMALSERRSLTELMHV